MSIEANNVYRKYTRPFCGKLLVIKLNVPLKLKEVRIFWEV